MPWGAPVLSADELDAPSERKQMDEMASGRIHLTSGLETCAIPVVQISQAYG
jgi:hypothetical protein